MSVKCPEGLRKNQHNFAKSAWHASIACQAYFDNRHFDMSAAVLPTQMLRALLDQSKVQRPGDANVVLARWQ